MGRPKALRIVDKRMERAKKNHQLKGDTKAAKVGAEYGAWTK